jgi:hypothetical protein
VGADSLEQAKGNIEKLSKIGKVQSVAKQLVMYIRNKGAMKLVGVMLRKLAIAIPASPPAIQEPANITANTTTLAPTTTPAPAVNATPNATEAPVVDVSDKPAPKKELAFGAEYSWVSIGDEEIDAAARKVAEWSARAEYRILQEKKAYAAVMGTRAEVKDAAGAAKETVEGAVDNVEDPGDSVIRALEKSEEHTQQAKEARRRVKVLKEYRVKVSAKRKVATTTRDQAIADLLRLKVLRINSAKALWMTLANKVVELNGILKTRLEAAHKAAEVAKQSEDDREPQQVTLSKLHASQKAMEAGRQTKVYLNAVIYKTHCAEKLLHDWECKVQVNCTLSGTSGDSAGTGADKPSWSTPTLDALAEHMNEAVGSWKEAQKAVPEAPPKPKPTEKSKIEKTLEKMEKKFGKTEGERECQCILDGGRCGRFVKGKGCVAVPGAVAETTDGATEKAKMAGAPGMDGASGGDAAGDSAAEKKKESSDESLLSRVEELETQLKSKLGKSKKKVATLKFL